MTVSMNLHECREKDRERAEIEAATKRFLAASKKNTIKKVEAEKRNNYIHRALVLPGSIDHTRGQMGRQGNESE